MREKNNGFTLVETVVTISVTTILLGFLLPMFLSVSAIYRETENANLIQIKCARAIDFLKDNIRSGTDIQVLIDAPKPLDGYSAIWCKDNKLYYQIGTKDAAVYMDDTSFALDISGFDRRLGVKLAILTGGEPYVLETVVALSDDSQIAGKSGTGIQFKTN